ncbi:MAG: DUF4193 family protein [Actinomycetota bacterium]
MARTRVETRTGPDVEEPEAVLLSVVEDEEIGAEAVHEREFEDEERAFERLEAAFLDRSEPTIEALAPPEPIRSTEFVCRSCFLVLDRHQLADAERIICADCARRSEAKRVTRAAAATRKARR